MYLTIHSCEKISHYSKLLWDGKMVQKHFLNRVWGRTGRYFGIGFLGSALALGYFGNCDCNGREKKEEIVDLDDDGMDDGWEKEYFGKTGAEPDDDSDKDGYTNFEEYQAGTNPTDPNSKPVKEKPEPGELVINEAYLDPGSFTETKYYANDNGLGPDGAPGYDACDKFVEVVNRTEKTLELKGIKLMSKEKEIYNFSGSLEPYQAAVIFNRGSTECAKKALPDLGKKVKVLGSTGTYFVSPTDFQSYLENKEGEEIDRVYGTFTGGISLVRDPELDATAFVANNQVELIKHPDAPCAGEKEGKRLAFSPGTCADGASSFDTGCTCKKETVEDIYEIKDAQVIESLAQGDLVINEAYLDPGSFTETKYYANDNGLGPDGAPGYDACDKFIEVVNRTGKTLDLTWVTLWSKTKKIYDFSGFLEPSQAVVVFYRGKSASADCTEASLPDLGEKVKVLGSTGTYFVSPSDFQSYLENKEGEEIDRVYGTFTEGISLVRNPELDAAEFLANKQTKLIKHPDALCAGKKIEGDKTLSLAFSPGTCADGASSFDTGCTCEIKPIEDVYEVKDVKETLEEIIQLQPGDLTITEVSPFTEYNANNDPDNLYNNCDKFIEVVSLTEAELKGAKLIIKGEEKHIFDSLYLGPYQSLAIFSGGENCPSQFNLPNILAIKANYSFTSLTTSGDPVEIRLNAADGTEISSFAYSQDLVKEWKALPGLENLTDNQVWEKIKARGYSFVRESGLDPSSSVIPHPFAQCFTESQNYGTKCTNNNGGCALSPGTCANGQPFATKCICEPPVIEDVYEVKDVSEIKETLEEIIPLQPGNLIVTEVSPFTVYNVDGDKMGEKNNCDKFIEITATTEVNLEGCVLMVEGMIKHTFGSENFDPPQPFILYPNQSLVIFSGSSGCIETKELAGLGYSGIRADSSFYPALSIGGENVLVELKNPKGESIGSFNYSQGLTTGWKAKFPELKDLTEAKVWDKVKAGGYSFIRESELSPTSLENLVVPHPFAQCFTESQNYGTKCTNNNGGCALSPGTCANGKDFPDC